MNFFKNCRYAFGRATAVNILYGRFPAAIKTKIIMRLNLIILFVMITCLQVLAASVNAQSITLKVKDAPVKAVFEQIKKQSGYMFFYKNRNIKTGQNITIELKAVPLREALDRIIKDQPFDYEIVDSTIVIKEKQVPRPDKQQSSIDVQGIVLDQDSKPLTGATVKVKGTDNGVFTDQNGKFYLKNVPENAVIQIVYIGYALKEVTAQKELGTISLQPVQNELQEVAILSTGYQNLPKERATGSFVQVNNELLERRISTNILDRLEGIASGLIFNKNNLTPNEKMGISIRGRSTIDPNVNANPLIVLDNFPYEGDLSNINPNDIESITLLKDAAAASIWGARAGNGVIVITSKKGTYNSSLKMQLNSNVTIGAKPDLFYSPNFVNSSDFIDVETYLFNQGYFDSDLTTNTSKPMVSPVIELLAKRKANPVLSNQIDAQIDALRSVDVRNDYKKYIYRTSKNQQYALNLNGGTTNVAYNISLGYDNNQNNLIRNNYNRLTLNSQTIFKISQKLELTTSINYFQTRAENNTDDNAYGAFNTNANKYGTIYPYAQLADAHGNPLAVNKQFNQDYINSMKSLGFLDYAFKPLEEISLTDNTTRLKSMILRGVLKYNITPFLNAQAFYQTETQNSISRDLQSQDMYSTRYTINRFAQRNTSTGVITYPFPRGGVLNLNNRELSSQNFRSQLNYNQNFNDRHTLAAIAGAEIREVGTTSYLRTSYGYDDELGTAITNINYGSSLAVNPTGTGTIAAPSGTVNGTVNRMISYYANASYTYQNKYTLTLSGRKDGANIFGVKTNDRITPLWSAGLAWEVSKEKFYPFSFLPYAKIRGTYGFNGNVYNASAYLTFLSPLTNTLTGLPYAPIGRAPNSELSWERVRNINVGIDFATKNNIINGSLELYQKDGLDLVQSTPLAPSSGFTSYYGNAASNRTKGIDLTLNTNNLGGTLKWKTNFLFSYMKDKITFYDTKYTTANLIAAASQFTTSFSPVLYPTVGRSLFGVYSYKSAGLDPVTGDPLGYVNGVVSKDYLTILNSATPDNIIYHGASRPTVFGSLMNSFTYKNFSISANITYKLGYYFRRTTTAINTQSILLRSTMHSDFAKRWQKPGDELITDVPSVVYPANVNRNTFYQGSSTLVERADHIRVQDIGFAYNIKNSQWKQLPFKSLQFNIYANNLGILWAANKQNLDPDYLYIYTDPNPRTISFGLKATL